MTAYFDSHCHLQDERFPESQTAGIVEACRAAGIALLMVNGTSERDWERVHGLAKAYAGFVQPCYGLHPWFVNERSKDWCERLNRYLELDGRGVGEIGLDKWIRHHDLDAQKAVFFEQIELARRYDLAPSIHCLRAWGSLLECLRSAELPSRGFLLHSYGGPAEMIPAFAELGAYFSFSGHFLHDRKLAQRTAFRAVPADRLLLETDAPDMPLPDELVRHRLDSRDGAINHPANLEVIYREAAAWWEEPLEAFAARIGENHARLFGRWAAVEQAARSRPVR